MAQEHILKTWPNYFDAVKRGEKPFEVRLDDRGYQKGDILVLQRTSETVRHQVDTDYHGKPKYELRKRVTYVLSGGHFGIEPGYVVMGLEDLSAGEL